MAKPVYVLMMTNSDGASEILGAYSENEFARNAAQIYINDVNDNYGYGRVDLEWRGNVATSRDDRDSELFLQFYVDSVTLDEDVRA